MTGTPCGTKSMPDEYEIFGVNSSGDTPLPVPAYFLTGSCNPITVDEREWNYLKALERAQVAADKITIEASTPADHSPTYDEMRAIVGIIYAKAGAAVNPHISGDEMDAGIKHLPTVVFNADGSVAIYTMGS